MFLPREALIRALNAQRQPATSYQGPVTGWNRTEKYVPPRVAGSSEDFAEMLAEQDRWIAPLEPRASLTEPATAERVDWLLVAVLGTLAVTWVACGCWAWRAMG